VEIWRHGKLIEQAKLVTVQPKIDFSRKPKSESEEPGLVYESSRRYRERLTAKYKRDTGPTAIASDNNYLSQVDFTELLSKYLSREFSEFEAAEIAGFFLRQAPVSANIAESALALAVSSKGNQKNLRFYFQSLEEQLYKSRR
jgi:hypothetical protein